MMDSDESMASSEGSAEGKPPAQEKKERQRLIQEKFRARVKEYDRKCAVRFAEIVRLAGQIFQSKEQKMEAELVTDVSEEKEPKFKTRVQILDLIIDLLKMLLDKLMAEKYFPNASTCDGKVHDVQGNFIHQCCWCGNWLTVKMEYSYSVGKCVGKEEVASI